ncbi:MAG TPA: DUF3365 domain-containing protein [Holophagaceae bacterium]|nr:DUF3365 domain-containing protein [Holophagaceae bacterium]
MHAQSPALVARAEAARSDLFARLSGRLQEVMKAKGPAAAVDVCQGEAPVLAEAVATRHGLRIGRTSWKLRNPANLAPGWAREAVAARQAEASFQSAPDGGLRALMPIRLAEGCLRCHGESAALDPEVRQAILARYPADQATGFKAGDLRGWFWVEIQGGGHP